jgi:hypothetical protein
MCVHKIGGRKKAMKIIKGWKMLSHDCGYLNDISGQTVVVSKKDFSNDFHVRLFESGKSSKEEGKTISPEYPSKSKADAFAESWMLKHPNGTV